MYRFEVGKTRAKRSFNVSTQFLFNMGFPIRHFSSPCPNVVSASCWREFVFVTASDRQHFHWAMDAVALIQHYFHDHKIVYYDLEHNTTDSFKVKVSKAAYMTAEEICSRSHNLASNNYHVLTFRKRIMHVSVVNET